VPRRSHLQIIAELLEAAINPITITGLIYKVEFHYSCVTKYLNELLNTKLMETISGENGKTLYVTTKKGNEFLGEIRGIKQLLTSTANHQRKTVARKKK
jgi:predicted transcriptional regulator